MQKHIFSLLLNKGFYYMRLSQYFLPVLRENPKEAQIASHRLMLRAGMVQQSSAGIYSYKYQHLIAVPYQHGALIYGRQSVLLWDFHEGQARNTD